MNNKARKRRSKNERDKAHLSIMTYLNNIRINYTTISNRELMSMFNYGSEDTLTRDLKAIESMGYINLKYDIKDTSTLVNGKYRKFFKKTRTISFKSSETGLIRQNETRLLGPNIVSECDKKGNYIEKGEWIVSRDNWGINGPLIKNPNFEKKKGKIINFLEKGGALYNLAS